MQGEPLDELGRLVRQALALADRLDMPLVAAHLATAEDALLEIEGKAAEHRV